MSCSMRYIINFFWTLVVITFIGSIIVFRYNPLSKYTQLETEPVLLFPPPPLEIIKIPRDQSSSCPDVSTGMMRGRWKPRPLTVKEKTEIETFLEKVRTDHNLPLSMQRGDGRCGNLTYPGRRWFRALCDPKGPTPCCYDGRCVSKSSDECRCPKCYDLRTQIHAEYSTWEPVDSRCQVKNFTASDACNLLQGTQLVVFGASMMRHVYTALLLVLSNNGFDGAFPSNMPKDIHDSCTGMYTFTEKMCRKRIKRSASFCNGQTNVSLTEFWSMRHGPNLVKTVQELLHKPYSAVIVSMGIHDNFNTDVYPKFMLPAIHVLKENKAKWPRLIWATNHNFGILKTPLVKTQNYEYVRTFNLFMINNLQKHNIPVFDTFNLTSGVMSPDGCHFGIGINIMKVQMLFNFLAELRKKEHW